MSLIYGGGSTAQTPKQSCMAVAGGTGGTGPGAARRVLALNT